MKKIFTYAALFAVGCMSIISCSKDDEPKINYSDAPMSNTELKAILVEKGFTFDAEGKLEINELVDSTTALDLSGSKLTNFEGVEMLPNLVELDLSNNGYGPVFDMATLPKQITAVDLTDNKIYDYEGLVDVKMENDARNTTVLRAFTKLYVPAESKFNVEDLMPYFEKNGSTTDMKMADAEGAMQAYNTLREIPDAEFRAFLQTLYSSVFEGDNINISKYVDFSEAGGTVDFSASQESPFSSIEGLEYFINNPFYPAYDIQADLDDIYPMNKKTISYLTPRGNIKNICLVNVNTNGIDLSKATSVANAVIYYDDNIESIDLSNTLISRQSENNRESFDGSIMIHHCPKLKSIKLAEEQEGILRIMSLIDLPLLEEFDMSQITALYDLYLYVLPNTRIIYPTSLKVMLNDNSLTDLGTIKYHPVRPGVVVGYETLRVSITEDVYNEAFVKFVNDMGKNDRGSNLSPNSFSFDYPDYELVQSWYKN